MSTIREQEREAKRRQKELDHEAIRAARRRIPLRPRLLVHLHPPKCAGTNLVRMIRRTGMTFPIRDVNGRDVIRMDSPCPRTREEMEALVHTYQVEEETSCVSFENDLPWIERGHPRFETFCVIRHPLLRMESLARSQGLSSERLLLRLEQQADRPFKSYPCPYGYHSNYYIRLFTRQLGPILDEQDVDRAMDCIREIDHVYVYELDGWQTRVPRDLGLRNLQTLQWEALDPRYDHGDPPSLITEEVRDFFERTSALDLRLYERILAWVQSQGTAGPDPNPGVPNPPPPPPES